MFRILLACIIVLYLGFGTFQLGHFITADEHYWIYERIPAYFDAVHHGAWKKTLVSDKPGITLALVSGPALFFFEDPSSLCTEHPDRSLTCDTQQSTALLFVFRLPLLLINALLIVLLALVMRRLTDAPIALTATTLIATAPILLGISQISNPDALLWSTGSLALFTYLAWLKTEEKKYLLFSILAFGFALLSKYAALALLLFFFFALLLFFVFETSLETHSLARYFRTHLLAWLALLLGASLIFLLFLPATYTHTSSFLKVLGAGLPHFPSFLLWIAGGGFAILLGDTFLNHNRGLLLFRAFWKKYPQAGLHPFPLIALTLVLLGAHWFTPHWSLFSTIPFDIKDLTNARYYTAPLNFYEKLLLEWSPFIFSLTPLTFIGLILAWLPERIKKNVAYRFEINTLSLIIIYYILALIAANTLATPRYLILLYPLAAFIAAIGLVQTIRVLSQHSERLLSSVWPWGLLLVSLVPLFSSRPYFLSYANALLPAHFAFADAWGQGGAAAADYLNSLPDAEHLTVWSDYYGVCEFFVGRCLTAYTFDPVLIHPDYYVLTRRGQIRFLSRADRWERLSGLQAADYYTRSDPDWQLFIQKKPDNFVKVFRVTY